MGPVEEFIPCDKFPTIFECHKAPGCYWLSLPEELAPLVTAQLAGEIVT